jgi:thiamine kinase-like enzyme
MIQLFDENFVAKHLIQKEDISSIVSVGGMTNSNYLVALTDGSNWVVRFSKPSANFVVNRAQEAENLKVLDNFPNLDVRTVFLDAVSGVKITEYWHDSFCLTPPSFIDHVHVEGVAELFSWFHSSKLSFANTFDPIKLSLEYLSHIHLPEKIEEHRELFDQVQKLWGVLFDLGYVPVASHNDPVPENILCRRSLKQGDCFDYRLIDWEYSGMNDHLWDVSALFLETSMSKDKQHVFFEAYKKNYVFDSTCFWQKILIHAIVQDYLWTLWTDVKIEVDQQRELQDYRLLRFSRLHHHLALYHARYV